MVETKFENGVKVNWDQHGNCFVSMPVNNIPKKQFDEWINRCKIEYSGKRWDLIMADYLKARAYEALLVTLPDDREILPEEDKNELGLLNGGKD